MNKVDNLNQASFNSRTPKGCDLETAIITPLSMRVSIHAPLKGATVNPFDVQHGQFVSIHAPLKGATQ